MADPTAQYLITTFYLFIVVLSIILISFFALSLYKSYRTRGFYLHDFERLSAEATALALETIRIRAEVESDDTAEWSVTICALEILVSAGNWDDGVRIALKAWEDIMLDEHIMFSDVESTNASGKEEKSAKKKRRSHGRYVIGLMRRRTLEGIERRTDMSSQLQGILEGIVRRREENAQYRANRRLRDGKEDKPWEGVGWVELS